MNKVAVVLAIVLFGTGLNAQTTNKVKKEADWSVRANWNYQFFSFSGQRTNSSAIGGLVEKRINYESTIGLMINHVSRMEDGDVQRRNLPSYQDLFHISPFIRKYYHKALDGPYTSFSLGMGIPEDKGIQWDIGGHVGYLLQKDKIAIDFLIQMGFGSFRHYEDRYDLNGFYLGNQYYIDYGFYFRPGINIGFAL